MTQPFGSQMNFLDPQLTSDGKPYGPARFKEIVKECYYISKNINTSYNEILCMTPAERGYIMEFISDELIKQKEMIDKKIQESKNKKY